MASATFKGAFGVLYLSQRYSGDDSTLKLASLSFSRSLASTSFTFAIRSKAERRDQVSRGKNLGISASVHTSSVSDPVSIPSSNPQDHQRNKSNETALVLIRHGQSSWNEKNLFTGCVDVPLSKRGVEEAIEAGRRISCIRMLNSRCSRKISKDSVS